MRMCTKCGAQIQDGVRVCPNCGDGMPNHAPDVEEMNEEEMYEAGKKIGMGLSIAKAIPFVLIGGFLILIGIFILIIDIVNLGTYDVETVGTFVELTNCETIDSGEEYCNAVYSYEVGGSIYNVEEIYVTNDEYEQSVTVSYDSENPSDSIVGERGITFFPLILGAIFLFLPILIIISFKKQNK